MRAARFAVVFLAGAVGLVALTTSEAPASASTPSASDCVSIRSAELTTGLSFDIQNGCDKRLSCALAWTLTCESASGKVTSKAKQEARFTIGASDSHQTTGSSATCKDGWKIDDVSWDCSPLGK